MKTSTHASAKQPLLFLMMACMMIGSMALSFSCKKEEKAASPQLKAEAGEQGYQFKVTVKDMVFNWRQAGNTLQVMVRAKTNGWVGVGFNATEGMKDAWFIMGTVKDGAAAIIEQHGNTPRTHLKKADLGGTDSVSNASGSGKDNQTEIRFIIPLKPADLDKPINPAGDTPVLLAYGSTRQMAQLHAFRAKLMINLSAGTYSILTVK